MDMAGNDTNLDQPKRSEDTVNCHAPDMSSNWHVNVNNITSTSLGMITMSNPIWDQSINGYCNMNVQNEILRDGEFPPSVPRMMLSHGLPHFPADSAFIERAARFSCFNGGNFGEPFSISDQMNLSSHGLGPMQHQNEVFVGDEAKNGVDVSGDRSGEAEFSGRGGQEEVSGKGIDGLNKRKRTERGQKSEHNENDEVPQAYVETSERQKGDPNPSSTGNPGGKNGSPGSDPPKGEYVHIRARRGQATNSHSLAERLRREKISERMKFLQDLVPGCSKVTGKAVMLDEIINYVQSLQRQVEFLSMKLATVNPRLDFNMEALLAKDILQPTPGLSSSLAFSPDMTLPFPSMHVPQHGIVHAGLSSIGNSTETLQRPINLQSTLKEPTSQAPNVWADELCNVVHNGLNSSAPLSSQYLSVSLPPSDDVKAEL